MVREIVHDTFFLSIPSTPAGEEDLPIARDLLETLAAHREECVGMAANMIGHSKRIIVYMHEGKPNLMLNPEYVKREGPYTAEEGCLSLTGTRKTTRYRKIKVKYSDEKLRVRYFTCEGFTAQIIQHETDHLEGILI